MNINITKLANGYAASLTSPSGEVQWSSDGPLDERTLRQTLLDLGCHAIDVGDALAKEDPEVRKALREVSYKSLSKRVGPEEAARIMKKVDDDMAREVDELLARRQQY